MIFTVIVTVIKRISDSQWAIETVIIKSGMKDKTTTKIIRK